MARKNPTRWTTESFIVKAREVHGDKYSYERSEYVDRMTGITVTCPTHGDFKQRAGHHMDGFGCAKCAGLAKKNTVQFVEEATAAHGDRYDYSLVDYKTSKCKVIIICKKHGEFSQMPSEHLQGHGCGKCADEYTITRLTKSTEQWIAEAKAAHGDKYIYDRSVYNGAFGKVEVVCPKHGSFWTVGVYHVASKRGCPRCKDSWLEASVAETLKKIGVEYREQATFAALTYKRRLKFDFYIPSIGLFIEANGLQHREAIPFYGGDDGFRLRQARDKAKSDFVANIPDHKLLIVWSGEDVERIVTDEVNKRIKAKSRKKKPETMPLLLSV